ncbi:MAG TPA: cohesin domain-containing protein [Jiangellaceae bacterium]
MRTSRSRRTIIIATLGLLAASASVTVATAEETPEPTYTVAVSSAQVSLGETVEVAVTASDVQDLYAYDLAIEFDPASFVYMPGSAESGTSGVTVDNPSRSSVRVVHTKLGTSPAANGDVLLATVTLRAKGSGVTTLDVSSLVSVATDKTTTTASDVGSAEVTVTTN